MIKKFLACAIVIACACPVFAHETAKAETKDAKAAPAKGTEAAMPAMDAETAKMMEKWAEAGTPGKQHEIIKQMEGKFDAKVTSWMSLGAEPTVSTATSANTMLFDGRYLEQKVEGDFMGMPFHGIGYMGYDNLKKQYYTSWMDNMSTMMMTTTGTADAANKVFTFSGECTDPMTGKPMHTKTLLTIKSPNEHVMEMWGPDAKTGKDYKQMEIVYTRQGNM